jgi:RNA-binding signal recognition particle 68
MQNRCSSKLQGNTYLNLINGRCVLIARSHTFLKDHIAALALYERAHTYLTKIPSSLGSFPEKDIPVTKNDVSSLATVLEGEMTRAHAHVVLSQPTSNESEYMKKVPASIRMVLI